MLAPLAGVLICAVSTVRLEHMPGSGCPDQAWLESSVTARLGYSPFAAQGSILARTRVACTDTSCSARLELRGTKTEAAPRQRTMTAPPGTCQELTESLALTLALAIDPQMARPASEAPLPASTSAPVHKAAPESPPVRVAPAPSQPPTAPVVGADPKAGASPPRRLVQLQATVIGHAAGGLSPYPTGGVAIGVGLRVGWFGALIEGRFDAPRSAPAPGGDVQSSVMLGTGFVCAHVKGAAACLSGGGGTLHVDGRLPDGRRGSSPIAMVGGRLAYELALASWVGLHVHVDVAAVLTRTTVVTAFGPTWATSPVCGNAGLGAVFYL